MDAMKIWIDIDNSPHVPFFVPIVAALKARGDSVLITTRRYAQTLELLERSGLEYKVVGEHAGASRLLKIINLLGRSWELSHTVRTFAPDVAISHGSRALSVCAWMMNIPSVLYFDYEWTEMHIFKRCASILACPTVLPESMLVEAGLPLQKIRRYDGFKEEVYLPSFIPNPNFRASLNIPDDKVMLTIRPSSMTSNYHDQRSEQILIALLTRLRSEPNVIAIVTPRTTTDAALVQRIIREQSLQNVRIPEHSLPGMQLLFWSDVVVSGGGTMNRESALLGTRTYSMFTGKRPSIDTYLASQGKLQFLEEPNQVQNIELLRERKDPAFRYSSDTLIKRIVDLVDEGWSLRP